MDINLLYSTVNQELSEKKQTQITEEQFLEVIVKLVTLGEVDIENGDIRKSKR